MTLASSGLKQFRLHQPHQQQLSKCLSPCFPDLVCPSCWCLTTVSVLLARSSSPLLVMESWQPLIIHHQMGWLKGLYRWWREDWRRMYQVHWIHDLLEHRCRTVQLHMQPQESLHQKSCLAVDRESCEAECYNRYHTFPDLEWTSSWFCGTE